jgi:hypothetical protein
VIDVAPDPGSLVDASKVVGTLTFTGWGDNVNAAVGEPAGGRMMPVGTSRMLAIWGVTVSKLLLVGVATIVTMVPDPPSSGDGNGAVYTVLAWPLLFVTMVRADSAP